MDKYRDLRSGLGRRVFSTNSLVDCVVCCGSWLEGTLGILSFFMPSFPNQDMLDASDTLGAAEMMELEAASHESSMANRN